MKWKTLVAALTLGLTVGAALPAASLDRAASKSKDSGVSKDDVRKAIAIFRRNPLNVQGEMTRPIIMEFAQDNPDVEIAISEKRMPWLTNKSLPEDTSRALVSPTWRAISRCSWTRARRRTIPSLERSRSSPRTGRCKKPIPN